MQIKEMWKKILKKSRLILFLLITALLLFSLIFWAYAEIQGYEGIQKTVSEIRANSTGQETLVKNLLKWERENVDFTYTPITGNKGIDSVLRLIYSNRPNLIFYNKLGACGEFSTLFMEMAKTAGIQARVAGTFAEDHQWNEVLINDKWVHVDPTLDPSESFDNPHVYENEWKWNLSKVYAIYNGEQIDVTDKYFEKIGVLNVTVNENNLPAENIEIVVESQFRMERDPDLYKAPLQTTYCTTASNGTCSFYLGENNYTILARKGDLPFRFSPYLLEFGQKNVTLTADSNKELVFSLPETKIDPLREMAYLLMGYIFIIGYFALAKPDFRVSKNIIDLLLKALQRFLGNLTDTVGRLLEKL
jgi:hypothetical protein